MQKISRLLLIFFVLAIVVIQFFQPEKNLEAISENHIFQKETIPENVKEMLTNACLDCHSNQTKYLWYHKIAPVSWMVNHHVVDGKKHLNLSDWGNMDMLDKIGTLDEICDEVEDKKMPIKAYIKMHKEAKISDDLAVALCSWTEKLSEDLLIANQ